MPAFQINDAEWSALVEEPGDVFLLYCSIRRFMDFETGIAGIRRRISEQMLREVLYIAPVAGRHSPPAVTRQKVRTILSRLEALGALMPIGPMVYQFPLAAWDGLSKTGTTKEQPKEQPREQPSSNHPEASSGAPFSEESETGTTVGISDSPQRNNLPPVSGNPMMMFPCTGHFSMPLDGWEPIPKSFKAIAFKNAVPIKALTPDRLSAFCSYWHVRPEKEQTQAQWEYQLVDHLKKQIQFAANSEGKANGHTRPQEAASSQRPGRKRSLSAVERVERAIEQQRADRAKACGPVAAEYAGEPMAHDGGDLRAPLDGEFWREPEA